MSLPRPTVGGPYLSDAYVEGTIYSTCRHCGKPIARGYWDGWFEVKKFGGSHGCWSREFIYNATTHDGYFLPHEPVDIVDV